MKTVSLFFLLFLFACTPAPKNETSSTAAQAAESSTQTNKEPVLNQCELVLGFDAWEPYQYLDVGGLVTGLDIELIASVAEKIGCKVSYQQGTWVQLLKALEQGEVDILLGASKTKEREEFAYFSDAYRIEEFSLYIRKDDKTRAAYNSLSDFINNESRIGIVESYVYGEEFAKLEEDPNNSKYFVNAMMGEMNIARLLDEDIDAFLEDSFVGATMLRLKALNSYIVAHEGITIQTGSAYVMFSQDSISSEQLASFNEALQTTKASQEYQNLLHKYSY